MKKFLLVLTSLLLTLVALSQQVINPETALSSYLNNEDCTKAWEIRDTYMVDKVQAFSLLLISNAFPSAPFLECACMRDLN